MRKVLLAALGAGAAFAAAVWMGAAAATTGAPVFYDAHYPAPATSASEGYTVGTGGGAGNPASEAPVAAREAGGDGSPSTDAPRASAPPSTTAPPTTSPRATPAPGEEGADDIDPPPGSGVAVPAPEEQERWLAFQQVVRDCMAETGHQYLDWEWWNPGDGAQGPRSAMPGGLSPDEQAAWEYALDGDAEGGDRYRWQDAGCWGYAVHVTGNTH